MQKQLKESDNVLSILAFIYWFSIENMLVSFIESVSLALSRL